MSRAQEIADLLSGVTITTADNLPQLTLKSTDADGGRGPDLVLTRDSASPADGDAIGFISWTADNDAGADHAFCGIEVLASDVSDGSEDATWQLFTQVGGTSRSRLSATPTETVFNEDSQDIDFRVESDSSTLGHVATHGLFLEASSGKVGIAEDSPSDYYADALVVKAADESGITIATADTYGHRNYLAFANDDSGAERYAGYLAYDHGDNSMQLGTGATTRLTVDSSGNVLATSGTIGGLGSYNNTTGSAANVHILSSGVLVRSTSSSRYKNTINDATHGLTELLTLRPVTYKGNSDGDTVFGGLIAEEVHDAGLTEFVQYNDDNEPDSLAYANMVSLCIKAIQEQQATITALEARIAALEAE
jgi:hypothetical protein